MPPKNALPLFFSEIVSIPTIVNLRYVVVLPAFSIVPSPSVHSCLLRSWMQALTLGKSWGVELSNMDTLRLLKWCSLVQKTAGLKFEVVERQRQAPPTPVSSKTESYNDEAMMETPSVTDTTQVYDFKTEINPFSPLKTEENTQHYVFLNKRPKKSLPPYN